MGVKVKKTMSKKSAQKAAAKQVSKKAVKKLPVVPDAPKPPSDANEVIAQVRAEVAAVGTALAVAVTLDKKLQDVRERELWKYCDSPFKSWSAYVADLRKVAGKSAGTLWGMIGLQKALPGSTAEERREIGTRKGAKLAKAAKVAKSRGQVLPPEVVEKAKAQTEPELDRTIEEAGLKEKPKPAPKETQDPLLAETGPKQAESLRKGGSGVVDGPEGSAQQFAAVVEEAIETARKIYDPEFSKQDALHFVCNQWLLSECDKEGLEDMTNRGAMDHLQREKKNGRAHAAHA